MDNFVSFFNERVAKDFTSDPHGFNIYDNQEMPCENCKCMF